jgi:hypothetical protein
MLRFRHFFMLGMFLLWPLLIVLTDPESGMLRGFFPNAAWASMAVFIQALGSKTMGLLFAWWSYMAFRDYEEADNRFLFAQVRIHGNVAAGLALIANALILSILIVVFCWGLDATAPAISGALSSMRGG